MKNITLKICLVIVALFGVVSSGVASDLPKCEEGDNWHNCFGTLLVDGDGYIGQIKDYKYSGQGTYIFADGDKYVGQWKDNERNGQGTYIFANGDKYVGQWKGNERNGQGTFTISDGTQKKGIWKNNELQYANTTTQLTPVVKAPSKPTLVAKIAPKDGEVLSASSSSGANKIFMICETEAMGERRVANGYAFHAEIDIDRKQLNWNGWKSNELKIQELRFFAIMECINPANGGCILPFVNIDRLTGDFKYQSWGDDGEYNGTCRVADKKKKLF